ncbi:MAG: PEP-CTERM sorting domain-containing protein [Planctomycetota bacterium]
MHLRGPKLYPQPPGWSVDYGSGTNDRITAVPEPSTLLLLGLGGLMVRRKR